MNMSCPFNDEQLTQLNAFVQVCKSQPMILHHPKLLFFKEYLVSLGLCIPTATGSKPYNAAGDASGAKKEEPVVEESSEDEEESVVELDMEGVIEPDEPDSAQEMGYGKESEEITDEDRDASDEKRSEAMKAFSEQNFDDAIKLYTEAIKLNPESALLFAKRGQVYLKQSKPNACIKDCTRALELNCDSAAAYKFRGRAYRLLGKFEEAAHDLSESLKIDYDDQANEWFNEVKPNAEKLRQHKLSVQRKLEDKEYQSKVRRARQAQAARSAASSASAGSAPSGPAPDSEFNFSPEQLMTLLNDPECLAAMNDPEITAALKDLNTPEGFMRHTNNPKVMAFIELMKNKMQKSGGAAPGGGGFPGGFPGFAGFGAGAGGAQFKPKPPSDDDVGLD